MVCCNAGLASRCLQLVVYYMPQLRQHFEQQLTGKQLNMLKHFDHLLKVSYKYIYTAVLSVFSVTRFHYDICLSDLAFSSYMVL